MPYYAKVIENVVTSVHVIADEVEDGATFLTELYGGQIEDWIETFTDGRRGKQAVIGDTYDPISEQFITPAEPEEEVDE